MPDLCRQWEGAARLVGDAGIRAVQLRIGLVLSATGGALAKMLPAFRFGLAREFFQGFTNEAKCNLHLELLYGDEPHHIAEALFKAFAKAADFACQKDPRIVGLVPSTKGQL